MIRFAFRFAAAVTLSLGALSAQAQAWPSKPVHFIVPFPPGGSVDPLARVLGARLQESLGQQFIVENKPGASGSIGEAFVAKSAPDGYTYAVIFDTHAVNQSLIPNLPYDTLKDFAPVMLVGTAPLAIVTGQSRPYRSFADIAAAAKAKPEALSIGSVGNGSIGHLSVIVVQQLAGFKVTHVPYKGGGPMMADVMGNQIELGIASTAALSANVKGGKLRALAITGDKRSHVMPDVPTLAEQGVPGFSSFDWWAIVAPAGTPRPIIGKFHGELLKALAQPDLRKQLTETLGMDLAASTPEALQKFMEGEVERWGKVVKANNVRAD